VLESSFILLEGVGEKREQAIWKQGIFNWYQFVNADGVKGFSFSRKKASDEAVYDFIEKRSLGEFTHFFPLLPTSEQWRIYGDIKRSGGRICYLDIETTGVSRYSPITVLGVYDGSKTTLLVKDRDLDEEAIHALFSDCELIVTFNGAAFDIPIIDYHFPGKLPRVPHLDIRFPLAKAGYRGGLKKIEQALGITRPDEVQGLDGYQAVALWHAWSRRGDETSLERLLAYNREDTLNLEPLARMCYDILKQKTLGPYLHGEWSDEPEEPLSM